MNHITNSNQRAAVVLLVGFFAVLSTAVMLGDGKQPIGDYVWIVPLFCAWVYLRFRETFELIAPRRFILPFIAYMLVFTVSAVFGDSLGYSVTAGIRILITASLFVLFYSLSPLVSSGTITAGIMSFGVFSIVLSFVSTRIAFFQTVPRLNLYSLTFGHNYLAGVLVFMYPLVIYLASRTRLGFLMLVAFGALIYMTAARGAWALLSLVTVIAVLVKIANPKGLYFSLRSFVVPVIVAAACVVFIGAAGFQGNPTIQGKFIRWDTALDYRSEYWQQAITTIRARPVIGGGPGTFYLQSLKHQSTNRLATFYAHSLPLQALAETGITGGAALILLYICALVFAYRAIATHDKNLMTLWYCLLLLFAYSCVEFSLDFFAMQVVFWTTTGFLIGKNQTKSQNVNGFMKIVVIVLSVFFISVILVRSVFEKVYPQSLFGLVANPFDARLVQSSLDRYIDLPDPLPYYARLITTVVHKNEPGLLYLLAKKTELDGEPKTAEALYARAAVLDPFNQVYFTDLLRILMVNSNAKGLSWVFSWKKNGFRLSEQSITRLLISASLLSREQVDELFDFVGEPDAQNEVLSKIAYYFGYTALNSDPETTRILWTAARDASPGWGYFHVELASLIYFRLSDKEQSKLKITECLRHRDAKGACLIAERDGFSAPGKLLESVKEIPSVLTK